MVQEVRLTVALGPRWTPFATVWPELELVFRRHQDILEQAWITSSGDLLFYLWRQDVIEIGGRAMPDADLAPIVFPRSERYGRCWRFADHLRHAASGQVFLDIHLRRRQQEEQPPLGEESPKSKLALRADMLYGFWEEHGFDDTWTASVAFGKILHDPRYANVPLLACGMTSQAKAWMLALERRREQTR